MGIGSSRLVRRLLSKRHVKLLMVGLDSSGKTTILYKLKLGQVVRTMPTIGITRQTSSFCQHARLFNFTLLLLLLLFFVRVYIIYPEALNISLNFWLNSFSDMVSEANVTRGHEFEF